ncbi:MAG: HGxxPAAW family protein [Nocardioidaceae bacterium]
MSAHHGNTPAAWTAVVIALLAFTVGGVGLAIGPTWWLFWVGVAMLPVAVIVGKVMSMAGLGDTP